MTVDPIVATRKAAACVDFNLHAWGIFVVDTNLRKKYTRRFGLAAGLTALLSGPIAAAANVELHVNATHDAPLTVGSTTCHSGGIDAAEPACTLRAALELAALLDPQLSVDVVLAEGEYVLEDPSLGPLLIPRANVSIIGNTSAPSDVVIRPAASYNRPLLGTAAFGINSAIVRPELRNLTLRGARSTVSNQGGAINCTDARIALTRVRVVDNQGIRTGGSRFTNCNARITESEFAENISTGSNQERAGAIEVEGGRIEIISSSFIQNRSASASALRVEGGLALLDSVTFHGNVAGADGSTVAVAQTTLGSELVNVTIVGNEIEGNLAGTPGLATAPSVMSRLGIRNSVIAGNVLGPSAHDVRLGPGVQSQGHNRVGVVALTNDPDLFGDPGLGDVRGVLDAGVDASLTPLTAWGFPRGLLPTPGGPLENAGASWGSAVPCVSKDGGGRRRQLLGGACDVGAVELFARPATWKFTVDTHEDVSDAVPGDGVCAGQASAGLRCSLRAAVDEANTLFSDGHFGPYGIELPADGSPYTLVNDSNVAGVLLMVRAEDATIEGMSPAGVKAEIRAGVSGTNFMLAGSHRRYSHGRLRLKNLTLHGAGQTATVAACENVSDMRVDAVDVSGGMSALEFVSSTVQVEDSRMFGNGVLGTSSDTVVADGSHLIVRRSVLHGNFTGDESVLLARENPLDFPSFRAGPRSAVTLLATTIANNVGESMVFMENVDASFWNATISGNSLDSSAFAVVLIESAALALGHTIIAGNGSNDIINESGLPLLSYGSNIIGNAPMLADYEHVLGGPDAINVAADGLDLAPFQVHEDWAGRMPDASESDSNLVINRGTGDTAAETATVQSGLCLAYDQRNLPRTQASSGACDIGALEYFPGALPEPEPDEPVFSDGFE